MEKYKITVSEPWDFEGALGSNIITGEIIKVLSAKSLLFKSDHLLNFKEAKGKILLLKSRYEDQILLQDNYYKGTVGGGLYLQDQYEDADENFLETQSKYVLIGSLSKM